MYGTLPTLVLPFPLPVPGPQLYEVQFDRTGGFTGVKLGMSLKGHKSKVFCLDFSPDLTKVGAACWVLIGCCLLGQQLPLFPLRSRARVSASTSLCNRQGECFCCES